MHGLEEAQPNSSLGKFEGMDNFSWSVLTKCREVDKKLSTEGFGGDWQTGILPK